MLRDVVRAEIGGVFDELRRFVDRRIAELSTELHAALELVDVSEHHLSDQLHEMHGTLSRAVTLPASAKRSSGVELEGIVQASDDAANNIMTAAEIIRSAVDAPDAKPVILEQVAAIVEACGFKEVTGERVRRALEQLQAAESARSADESPIAATGPDLSQDEINRLFS